MGSPLPMVLLLVVSPSLAASQQTSPHPHTQGTVRFSTSCRPAVQPQFNQAIALLHSFAFGQAESRFRAILTTDPNCAMAYWAIGLGAWGNPFAPGVRSNAQIDRGLKAIQQARQAGSPTAREQGYIDAAARLYLNASGRSQPERLADYRDAMQQLSQREPADTEARIFYALALDISADPTDKTYRNQLQAAGILEPLFRALPDHPGLAHYLIHTYDVPRLAGKGVSAAEQYSRIAPDVSHALHMPSHVYTRVGMWDQSISANTAAAARAHQEGSIAEELHAMDYQLYAMLQLGNDSGAARLLGALPDLAKALHPDMQTTGAPPSAGYFALAAMPARYALERGQWAEAARLSAGPNPIPWAAAQTAFAKAIGAARAGDSGGATSGLAELTRLQQLLESRQEKYWANQVSIQRSCAQAWFELATGEKDQALATMGSAADREDATEKSVVTPGPLAPAREQLGEMLLQTGNPAEALKAFQQSLTQDPGRRRSIRGAADAAGLARQ